MAFSKDHRTPSALTGIARGTFDAVFGDSLVSSYLPASENRALNYSFTPDSTALPESAAYRSFGTESDVGSVDGSQTRQGKLPPISRRLEVDEYSYLLLTDGDVGATFEDYSRRISAQIATRLIEAGAEAIETGKVTITERGQSISIDYGRKAALTATAPKLWSDPTADVISDLEALRTAYGSAPGAILLPATVQQHLTKNAGIIQLVVGRASDLPARVSYADVLSVLASFGFTGLFTNQERLVDSKGATRTLFSQDKVVFLPGSAASAYATATGMGSLGTTDLGVTAEALSTENGLGGSAGLASGVMPQSDPEGFAILVSAIALPVVRDTNSTASLKVL